MMRRCRDSGRGPIQAPRAGGGRRMGGAWEEEARWVALRREDRESPGREGVRGVQVFMAEERRL